MNPDLPLPLEDHDGYTCSGRCNIHEETTDDD